MGQIRPTLQQRLGIRWHKVTIPGCSVATFTDEGTVSDNDLRGCLSPLEMKQAEALHDLVERRHFLARRCFQRVFVCGVLACDMPPGNLALKHQRDSQPRCLDAPGLHLSFSSSGSTAIACASTQKAVGIDIERMRVITNPAALARRFFSPKEAETLAAMPMDEQNIHFLHHWTAKEAALKAIGKGIVYGLNTFTVARVDNTLAYNICGPNEDKAGLRLQYLGFLPQHVIALVEKINVGNS
jgi:phosphopantetheine--protein transferase-like protein